MAAVRRASRLFAPWVVRRTRPHRHRHCAAASRSNFAPATSVDTGIQFVLIGLGHEKHYELPPISWRRHPVCDILLEGLASDGGLYPPELSSPGQRRPAHRAAGLSQLWLCGTWPSASSLYIDDYPARRPQAPVREDVRLRPLTVPPAKSGKGSDRGQSWSNGPTLALCDITGSCSCWQPVEYRAAAAASANILGATSGALAARLEYAMRVFT